MRTDPRADEVRHIVERVFSGYFQNCRERENASYPLENACGRTGLPAGRLGPGKRGAHVGRNVNPLAGVFPRLHEAAEEDPDQVLPEIDETILIDEGRYVARSYRTAGYMAMWLVAVGLVQFYDDRGRMLTTINLFESLRPLKMAA